MKQKNRSVDEWAYEWYAEHHKNEKFKRSIAVKSVLTQVLKRISVIKGLGFDDIDLHYPLPIEYMTESELCEKITTGDDPLEDDYKKLMEEYSKYKKYESKIKKNNSLPEDTKKLKISTRQYSLKRSYEAYLKKIEMYYDYPNGKKKKFEILTEEEERLFDLLLEKIPSGSLKKARNGQWDFLSIDERAEILALYFNVAKYEEYLLIDAEEEEIKSRILQPQTWRCEQKIQDINYSLDAISNKISVNDMNTIIACLDKCVQILDKYKDKIDVEKHHEEFMNMIYRKMREWGNDQSKSQ